MSIDTSDIPLTLMHADLKKLGWGISTQYVVLISFAAFLALKRQIFKKTSRLNKKTQRSERKKMAIPLKISTPVTHEFSIRTFDISLSGAFLSYTDLKKSMSFTSLIGKRTGIKRGDLIDIKIQLGRFSQISCQARVVRYDLHESAEQPGIGLAFIDISRRQQNLLSNLLYKKMGQKAS